MAVVTASEYKTWKGISGSTYDAQLAVVVPAAILVAEKFCNRTFEFDSCVEKFDGTSWTKISVSNPPISSITYIKFVNSSGLSLTVPSTSYSFATDDSGVIGFNPVSEGTTVLGRLGPLDTERWVNAPNFDGGFHGIEVSYVGGFEVMPDSLKFAMYSLIDVMLGSALQKPGSMNFKSERMGNYDYANWTPAERNAFMETYFGIWRRGIP